MKAINTREISTTRTSTAARTAFTATALSVTALSLAMGGADSHAQERRFELEEIVVTATRREEGLQSIPASITAVTAAELQKQGITDFRGLSDAVAGIYMEQPSNFTSNAVYVRGIGTNGTSPSDRSVGILVDGVFQLREGAVFNELMDIERIEVLRGPQGTLFGRNTTAGVIKIETADPDTSGFSGKVQAIAGNLGTRELRGMVNIPVVEDRLALRLNAFTAKRDGHTRNIFTDEDTRNVDREGYRGKLLWDVTDNFQVKASAEKMELRSRMDQAMPVYPANLVAQFPELLGQYPVRVGTYAQQASEIWSDTERYVLNLKWEFANHTLSTISAWETFEAFVLDDRDRTPLEEEFGPTATVKLTNQGLTDSTTHEIQLSSNFDGPFNYLLGYYFQNDELESTTNLYRNDGPQMRPPSFRDVDSTAYFGNITYAFNDQWTGSLGVRYTDDEKQGANAHFSGITKFDEWTYSLKLSYQIDPDRMVYIAHDTGFKSGGINRDFAPAFCQLGLRCLEPDETFWEPETTDSYEIGMKGEFLDNRLRLNAALFYQTYENFQVTQNLTQFSNVLVRNAAEVESMGLEADIVYLASDNLSLNGSLAYIRNKYDKYENATCLPGTGGCVNGFKDLTGKTLDHSPKLTFNVGGEYRDAIALGDGTEWFARVDATYRGDQNLFYEQYDVTEQDAYFLVNARVGLESIGNGWTVTLWGRNLTNKTYLAESLLDAVGPTQVPGLRRTYGITVDYAF